MEAYVSIGLTLVWIKSLLLPIDFLWKELRLDAATTLQLEQTWVLRLPIWSKHGDVEEKKNPNSETSY